MWQVKNVVHRFAIRSGLLVGTTTLLATLAIAPSVNAQVTISINPPVCAYGYYDFTIRLRTHGFLRAGLFL